MAESTLALLPSGLTERQERFCKEYFSGENAGNGTRSYLASFENSSMESAAVGASNLLRDPRIIKFLAALREEALGRYSDQLQPWDALIAEAQAVLIATMQGKLRSRMQYEAAQAVLDRALGKPQQRLEHQIALNEAEVERSLKLLSERRLTDGSKDTP